MLTFYNERGEGFGAQVEFTVKNAVNGERSVSGTIISNDRVLSEIDRGWKFELNGEFYNIVYAKPRDEGRNLSISFDAVHQFFYDFGHSNCYTEFNGSHRFEVYIEAIFKNSGYRYQIEPSVRVNSIRKENFGNAKRLEMLKDIIKAAGLEFSVSGKVVLITKKIGSDLSTVVRKNFNMNELVIEKNINKFITYKRGLGAWKDENNHNAGRYEAEYESPLARIYGRIEGEPVIDERYKDTGKLLERLKFEVDNSYSISVQLDMENLTRAGYQYTQPRAGDYIMAINETIGFREKIRIVSFESSYDVTGRLINHKVACNDIGAVQKQISSEGSIMRSVGQSKEFAESALAVATRALVSADGKNTVYYGATKPKDEPIGTIKRGDILYLATGEDTEMYIWNGSEWELKKLKFDTAELEKEFDKVKKAIEQASEENKRRTEEALEKSGANTSLAEEALKIGRMASRRLDALKRDSESMRDITFNTLGEIDRNLKKEINTTSEYRRTTDEMLSRMTGQMDGFATKSEVRQDVAGLTETFAKLKIDTNNLISGTKSEITAAKTEFKKTADGLSTKMTAVERYVNQDDQRQEALQRYAREESAKQATSVRELVSRDFVGKSSYQEDVAGINQKIEAVKTTANKEIATQIANYRQSVDGKFTDISSQVTTYKQVADGQIANLSRQVTTNKNSADQQINNISGQVSANKTSADNQIANLANQLAKKVEITDFQRVRETSQLYERILGTTEQGLPDKVSRLVMSSSIFQTEVGNFFASDNNLIVNSETLDKYTLVNQRSGVSLGPQNGIFSINAVDLTSFNWSGFTLPIYVPKILKGEVYTLSFKYKIKRKLDHEFYVAIKNHSKNKAVLQKVVANPSDPISSDWIEFQATSTMSEDFEFGLGKHYPLYFFLVKNGYVEIKEPILVRGARSSSYKPSQFDDAYKATENAKQLAENAQAKAVQVAEQVNQAQETAEATRTRVNQLAGSWAVQNLTSEGSIVSQINATNNQILIEAEKIRLKGKTLLDELTAIQGYFKRLFVGEGTFATLNTDILRANSITADKLVMDMAMVRRFVSSDIFTDTLAAKEAFINKLRSVVVSATLLEGYKGRIGGFQIGTHQKDPSVYWITGQDQFAVGMSNGSGKWGQTALWVNWGWDWNKAGPLAWYVKHDGTMYCNSTAYFKYAEVSERLFVDGDLVYRTNNGLGFYNYSPIYQKIDRSNNYLYLYYNKGNNYDWIPMNREISDRRYKHNIDASTVSGLDVIENLKTYSYRKEYDGKIEDIACGIMAQDVQKYVPEAFYENPDGAYSYRTFELVPYLIKAIQELNQKIEKLEKTA